VLAELVGQAEPSLVRLEAPGPAPSVEVLMTHHRALRGVPRVRSVVIAIKAAFRARRDAPGPAPEDGGKGFKRRIESDAPLGRG
jgi:hypothetical protein